ncbi:type I restriction-modification system subunit M [Fulvivirgaceae bacterium PWU5]|uniref:site-specific DNA-methyltransferase (adenine-specific) n=1 Tax=Dawidia cretensis TaxID=2782350 RepID=A0AAP2E2T9_9BACT|nr:N-6 DNA methylase [Dawidia cretensis]MBT1710509.1 type I restriction-modification system subunit M [Dawidia cretensis]
MNLTHELTPDTVKRHRLLWHVYKMMARTYTFADSLQYTAGLLLLRTISTGWHTQWEVYKQRYGAGSPQVARMMMFHRFQLPEKCSFEYLLLHREKNDIAARATRALRQLDACNPDTLQSIFRDVDFDNCKPGATGGASETIRQSLKYLSRAAFDTEAGAAFHYLLEKLANARENHYKALFVPPAISHLVALLAAPRAGERIGDPVCGCGALLVPTVLHTRARNARLSPDFSAFGQEHHDGGFRLARIHTHLYGLAGVRLEVASSITDPRFLEEDGTLMKFDVAVANLMISLEHWGYTGALADQHQRFRHGLPPRGKGDYAYVQHILATLAPGGRAVILMALNALSRQGTEAKIRQALVEANVIDAVIALPANLFADTAASTAVLILRPSRTRNEVLFIDARQYYQSGRKQHLLRPQDITRITAAYACYENLEELAVCIPREEIARNSFNLSVAPYIRRAAPAGRADVALLRQEIDQLNHALRQTRVTLDTLLQALQDSNNDTDARTVPYTYPPTSDVFEDALAAYDMTPEHSFCAAIRHAIPYISDVFAAAAGEGIQAVYRQRIIRDWKTNTDWQRETDRDVEDLLYTLTSGKSLPITEAMRDAIRFACREAAARIFQ